MNTAPAPLFSPPPYKDKNDRLDMSRIVEEPRRHIHDALCSELNEMSIRLKLWDDSIFKEDNESKLSAILKARWNHKKPSNEELISLIERCRDEMNQCTDPFRIKR